MFGHQDDRQDDDASSEPENVITPDHPAEETAATDTTGQTDTAAPKTDGTVPATDTAAHDTAPAADGEETKPEADGSSEEDNAWQHPGAPLNDDEDDDETDDNEDDEADTGPEPIKDIVGSSAGPDFKPFPQSSSDFHGGSNQTDNTPHELIDIKQKALDDLTPLVGQLDQSPEDKFRTIMMMIQAKDDQSLIQSAYTAAHEIKDEKARAQALLDVVNEINYFTQHPEN
jgi:hypothetical protein